MKHLFITTCLLLAACNNSTLDKNSSENSAAQQAKPASLKMYALECGRIEMLDLGLFDKDGAYDGRTNSAVSTCYLVRHPKGDLLWDTGLPDALHQQKDGVTNGPFHVSVPNTLADQLHELNISPEDIEYLSLSHSHFDHISNAGQYAQSTFLVHENEYAHMFRDDAKKDEQNFASYSALENAKTVKFSGNYDVFGDGSVTIIETPGHTPGHTVLQLELEKSGTVLLTGDLYHFHEAREKRTIPVFNTSAEQTLQSMDKFEALAKEKQAKVIIQHSLKDYNELPKPPLYLD